MGDEPGSVVGPRYRWPWFVLGAVVLGAALAALWMAVAVRRIRDQRDPMLVPSANPPPVQSESSAGKTNVP